jgi:hypothetical protein
MPGPGPSNVTHLEKQENDCIVRVSRSQTLVLRRPEGASKDALVS